MAAKKTKPQSKTESKPSRRRGPEVPHPARPGERTDPIRGDPVYEVAGAVGKDKSLAILIVEDSESDAQLIFRALRKEGYQITFEQVETVAQMQAALSERTWDVVISDYSLPQFDGPAALKLLQETGLDIPFIAVSGTIGEETAVAMMKAGAHDFLMKENLTRLAPAIERELTQADIRRERLRASEKLRESEERFRALIENGSDSIALVGADGSVMYASPAITRILGYSIEEYLRYNAFELIHPEDLQQTQLLMSKILEHSGEAIAVQARQRHKDGSWRWLEGIATNLLKEPAIQAIVVNFSDITERKQAEVQLRASEERYRELYNNLPTMCFTVDGDGTTLSVNHFGAEQLGYTQEELVGESVLGVFHEEDKASAVLHVKECLEHKDQIFQWELRKVHKNGSMMWVKEIAWAVQDRAGKHVVLIVCEDITRRKQVEAENDRRVSELEALYENGLAISQLVEPNKIAHKMVEILSKKLNWHHAAIRLYHPDDDRMELLALGQPGLTEQEIEENIERLNQMLASVDRGVSGWVTRHRQTVRSGNLPEDPRYVESYSGMNSGLYVPLQLGSEILGSIAVESEERDAFNEEDERLLVTLANQATIAIRNAQLYLQTQHELEERKRAEQERRRLIHDLGERVKELTVLHNASRIFMDQSRDEQQVLEELISILPPAWQYPEITVARISFDTRQYGTANFKTTPWMQSQFFALPNNHKCLIEIAYLEEKPQADEGPFLKEERYVLDSLAEKLQSFLAAKVAEASIQRHSVEMSLMLEVGRELSNTVDLKEIYAIVYRYISRWVPCDHLVISSYDPGDQMIRCEYLYDNEGEQDVSDFPPIPLEPEGQGTQSRVIRNGKSLLLPDYLAQLARTNTAYNFSDHGEIIEDLSLEAERTRSAILVPFIVQGHVNGVMQVFHHTLNAHTEDHLHFVESLAFRVSGALVNAKLFHQLQVELLQRRLVEDEIRHLNTELEQRVEERTAEIESTSQRLEIAANAGGIGVWEINFKNNQVFWDRRMYAIHGLQSDAVELSLELWWSRLHPDDLAKAQGAYQTSLEKTGKLVDEHRVILTDGSIRHITANAIVIYDIHGLPERMVGVNIDVTQQRQAEHALHESETYARLLFDAAPDPVFVEEVDGVMVDVNNLFEQQHQVKRENIRGKHISTLGIFPSEEIDKARAYVAAITQNDNIPPVELDFYAPDNEIHTLEMHSYPIEVGGKNLVVSTSRDITVHKKAEETLRLANAEMERALRIKDEFLASMSHELRTPLNAILGISESLEEQIIGPLNEKQMKYLRTINESGHHLHELINDILDLSKIEAGRLELNILDVHAEHLCQASLRMIKELAQKKGLNLMVSIDPQVKTLQGDERRLKQALVNLLSNAVKFTPAGQEIGLELKGHPENSEVTFTVWDHGIGIAAKDISNLFKPFVQLDSSLSREYAGTGLGLALVAQMVRLHGGSVGVESELGRGSRFTITLSWTPDAQSARAKVIAQNAATETGSGQKRSGTILIVEDTDTVITLMSEYLQHKGYTVLLANNGMEGVTLARQQHPDLILLDVMMPVMDGLEAARQIRADETLQKTPMIGLTALAMPGDRERCIAAGMNDYLSKPIEFKELMEILDRHLPPVKSEEA